MSRTTLTRIGSTTIQSSARGYDALHHFWTTTHAATTILLQRRTTDEKTSTDIKCLMALRYGQTLQHKSTLAPAPQKPGRSYILLFKLITYQTTHTHLARAKDPSDFKMAEKRSSWPCNTCSITFPSSELQRSHMRQPWQ
jgi:hypothetical protein